MKNLEDILSYDIHIDEDSKNDLYDWIKNHKAFFVVTLENQVRYELYQTTLIHQPNFEYRTDLVQLMQKYEGKIIKFNAISIGYSDKAMAFGVDIPSSLCENGKAYITICTMNGGTSRDSEDIENWFAIGEPIPIKGKLLPTRKMLGMQELFFGCTLQETEQMYYNQSAGLISEAYYKTYPVEKVKREIERLYSGQQVKIYIQYQAGDKPNVNILTPKNIGRDSLEKVMSLCGYTLDAVYDYDETHDNLQYSPRYPDDLTNKVLNQKYLFHVSPSYTNSEISRIGLVPSSRNKEFKFPGRVYLFLNEWSDGWETNFQTYQDLMYNANLLKMAYPQIKNTKDNRYPNKLLEWTVYVIDTEKLKPNTKFYRDTNWMPQAVFTYDNIPKEAIIAQKDFKLPDKQEE